MQFAFERVCSIPVDKIYHIFTAACVFSPQAKRNGADAVEFDIDYTSDGVAVVIHDDTVDRTTDGTGVVRGMTLDKLRKLNASAKHHKQ